MMPVPIRFALNHMTTPKLPPAAFFALARDVGITGVEIRNDLAGNAIQDGTPPADIARAAREAGVELVSINALQRFNEWSAARSVEAEGLAGYAEACGAQGLVLVPKNDGTGQEDGIRQENLRQALRGLAPILAAHGLIGLVEPLGFEISSLRSKAEAIAAVEGGERFRLVHDTFHHHLAGEPALFPELTGLVHISGVTDAAVAVAEMRDSHRVLVTEGDRLDNLGQIAALQAAGYAGYFSFEPFAAEVHAAADPAAEIKRSIAFVRDGVAVVPS